EQPQFDLLPSLQPHVAVQDRPLIRQDILADSADRGEVRRIRTTMGRFQLLARDADPAGVRLAPIEPAGVFEYSVEPPGGHVAADPLDNLTRAEGLTERRDRPRPPLGAHDVPPGA